MRRGDRVGEAGVATPRLKSIWEPHILRDFDLRVIMQMAGCEDIAERILAGESVSPADRGRMDRANYIAKQKGYMPIFITSGLDARILGDGAEVLKGFFGSEVWAGRNPKQTRRG
ncbi:hypothetical protein ACW4FP_04760 [Paenarthrobacter ureafaciens]